jgi:hypothetical protein
VRAWTRSNERAGRPLAVASAWTNSTSSPLPPPLHHSRLPVEPHHPFLGTDAFGEQVKDAEDATTDVNRRASGLDADQVEELVRLMGVDQGLLHVDASVVLAWLNPAKPHHEPATERLRQAAARRRQTPP